MNFFDRIFDGVARWVVLLYAKKRRPKSGFCVVIEAPDGAGKTTQVKMLLEWLESVRVRNFMWVREPGGTVLGEKIRDILLDPKNKMASMSEAFLFAMNRIELLDGVVHPALGAGHIVIMDRHVESSIVYQGFGRGIKTCLIRILNIFGTVYPDLRILILVDRELSTARQRQRSGRGDRLEQEGTDFKERVSIGYRWLARTYPRDYVVINGNGSPEEVFEQIKAAILSKMPELADR